MFFSFKGYFGGTVECNEQAEGEDKYDPKELVCGGCSNKERDQVRSKILGRNKISLSTTFHTTLYVRPAKTQISLRGRAG